MGYKEPTKSIDMVVGWLESQLENGSIDKEYGESILAHIDVFKKTIDKNTELQIEHDRMEDPIREQAYQEMESYYKDQKANQCLTNEQRHLVLKVIEECQKIVMASVEVRKG